MPIKEYNELLEQIDIAGREVIKAHSMSADATLKVRQELESTLSNLCMVERQCWGDHKITVRFNERAMFDLAMRKLVKTFSEEELAPYDFVSSDDFCIGDLTLGHRKPDNADLAPGAETL